MASFTGFFSQQLVQFQNCLQRDLKVSASISRTNSYTQTGGSVENMNPAGFPPMVAAINIGMLQPVGDLTNALSTGCDSGNCTFPDGGGAAFSTLAIRHKCSDITSHIRIVNQTEETNHTSTSTFLGLDYGSNKSFEWSKKRGGTVLSTWTWKEIQNAFTTIYFVFRQGWSMTEVKPWYAVNCTILPTIDTYSASIDKTVLHEHPIDIVPLLPTPSEFTEQPVLDKDFYNMISWYSHLMVTNSTMRDGHEVSCEGSEAPAANLTRLMKSTSDPTYVNVAGHTDPRAGWKWWYYPNDCVWAIHKLAARAISDSFDEVFGDKEVSQGRRSGLAGPIQLRVMFDVDRNITFSTIDEKMKNMTTLMTSVVRTNGGDFWQPSPHTESTPEFTKGDVWINTTCVSIKWEWITFPAVIIWLTSIFLVSIALENRGVESNRLWKSSFLAALFCDVELHEMPVGKTEISVVAKSTSVSLEGKIGILRLIVG
jgi:hypothetical protein